MGLPVYSCADLALYRSHSGSQWSDAVGWNNLPETSGGLFQVNLLCVPQTSSQKHPEAASGFEARKSNLHDYDSITTCFRGGC